MFCAGYLLVGGKSSRMGSDKALLPLQGQTVAQFLAARLAAVAHPVTLLGDPARYQSLGYSVLPDLRPGDGPLAGIQAALTHSESDWNLILGCDMPDIPVSFLQLLTDTAIRSHAGIVIAEPLPGAVEPLCAVYHRRCLPAVDAALAAGRRRVKDLLTQIPCEGVTACERAWFRNLNTPEDWTRYQAMPATL